MVESKNLDAIFRCLADHTRRDILRRVSERELSMNEIAQAYKRSMSLAAVSKHVGVLEKARLVHKRRVGKQQLVALSPPPLHDASKYLEWFRELWEKRLDSLEKYLQVTNNKKK
jgi:DNA-binding transcriptional ArsR family regulator